MIYSIIYIILSAIALLIAHMNNLFVELFIFILSFYYVKEEFGKQFHADYLTNNSRVAIWLCLALTFITMNAMTLILVEFQKSFFLNVLLGFGLGALSELVARYIELAFPREWTVDYIKLLKQWCNLTDLDCERLTYRYINKKKYKEIAIIYCVEIKSIEMAFSRIRKQIKEKYPNHLPF